MHYCTNYFLIYEKFLLIYYKIRGMMLAREPSAQGPLRKWAESTSSGMCARVGMARGSGGSS